MNIETLLTQIDGLKSDLNQYRHLQSEKVTRAFELEYTYESNRIEGNTLTLQETALVVEKGLTIGGKNLQEHLEAINHAYALDYVKELATNNLPLTQTSLLNIHQLILQSINNPQAGRYRNVQVLISGAKHIPPQPYLVPKQMEDFFIWYDNHKNELHPVELAAELHERLVTVHPFTDGNGRTARLLMNLILLQNGYPIAILKGDTESRLHYYQALEQAQTIGNKIIFVQLVAHTVKATLQRLLYTLKGE